VGIGSQELILIMVVALLVFGPKRLPEIGKSVGSALRELRRASNDFMSVIENEEPEETWEPKRHTYATEAIGEPENREVDLAAAPEPDRRADEDEKAGE
jgi:sec-independent protein translocase protein TatA